MLNTIAMVGNLVRDPEYRTTPKGITYSTFVIANDCGKKGIANESQATLYIECVIYGRSADVVAKHFRKGSAISITGRLVPNKYTSKDGEEKSTFRISCDRFDFISPAPFKKRVNPDAVDEPTDEEMSMSSLDPTTSDDLPF